MRYRLTVTLGRETVDRGELLDEGERLDDWFNRRLQGGNSDGRSPVVPDVIVDPVKAAIVVVSTTDAPNALDAAILALARLTSAFEGAGLSRPTSICMAEAESVPGPTGPNTAREHVHPLPHER